MTIGDAPKVILGLGDKLIAALPPTFILLCAINLVFLWLVLSFVGHQLDERMRVLNTLIEHCEGK